MFTNQPADHNNLNLNTIIPRSGCHNNQKLPHNLCNKFNLVLRLVMADLADSLKNFFARSSHKQAVNEVLAELRKIGLRPASLSEISKTPDSPVVTALKEWVEARTAQIGNNLAGKAIESLAAAEPPATPRTPATKMIKPTRAPSTHVNVPKVRESSPVPEKGGSAPQVESASVLPPIPAPAPATEMGSSLTFEPTRCGIADFADAAGYVLDSGSQVLAKMHFAATLTKICTAIVTDSQEAAQGVSNRVVGQRREIEMGGAGTLRADFPHADVIKALSAIRFIMGGIAYSEQLIPEITLSALKSHLLQPTKCPAIVHPNSEGKFEVILAAPADLKQLRAKILEQL